MDRKLYMKDIYSKYWIYARKEKYGFLKYDKNLCNYICNNVPKDQNILEVAIGTGFPFGDFLQKQGYNIYGVDIAPTLIEQCKKLNNKIHCKVGDAENLEYPTESFYCTYCFHSTFYFPDVCKAIDEMLRVTSAKGFIIFDIQNKHNHECVDAYKKRVLGKNTMFGKFLTYLKNILKIISRNGVPDWTNTIHEVPIYPEIIYKHLEDIGIKNYKIMVNLDKNIYLKNKDNINELKDYSKLIFVIRK